MAEQRLIDANSLLHGMGNYDLQVVTYKNDDRLEIMTKVVQAVQDHAAKCVLDARTINPEDLPIVQQLREELARVAAERNAAVRDMHQNAKCFVCANLPEDRNMEHCMHYSSCGLNYMHWVWRGLQKEG